MSLPQQMERALIATSEWLVELARSGDEKAIQLLHHWPTNSEIRGLFDHSEHPLYERAMSMVWVPIPGEEIARIMLKHKESTRPRVAGGEAKE